MKFEYNFIIAVRYVENKDGLRERLVDCFRLDDSVYIAWVKMKEMAAHGDYELGYLVNYCCLKGWSVVSCRDKNDECPMIGLHQLSRFGDEEKWLLHLALALSLEADVS